jgi:hypothetical protein
MEAGYVLREEGTELSCDTWINFVAQNCLAISISMIDLTYKNVHFNHCPLVWDVFSLEEEAVFSSETLILI